MIMGHYLLIPLLTTTLQILCVLGRIEKVRRFLSIIEISIRFINARLKNATKFISLFPNLETVYYSPKFFGILAMKSYEKEIIVSPGDMQSLF